MGRNVEGQLGHEGGSMEVNALHAMSIHGLNLLFLSFTNWLVCFLLYTC